VPYRPDGQGRDGPRGQTSTINIAPLGRSHHRVETHGRGWTQRQPTPGIHHGRTPHGHWARVDHHGTHTLGRDLPTDEATLLDDPPASHIERAFAELILAS
jgi:hypothetical protein